jgi:hypothetical protein
LSSCSRHPEDGHMTGRNTSVTTMKLNYFHKTKVNLLIFKNILRIKLMQGIRNISKRNYNGNSMQTGRKIVECPNYSTSKTAMTEIDVNYCNSFRTSEHWNALRCSTQYFRWQKKENKNCLFLSECIHFFVSNLG